MAQKKTVIGREAASADEEKEWLKQEKVIYGALAGVGLILIQPFLVGDQLTTMSAKILVISFAIAIPILAALILLNEEESFRKRKSTSKLVGIARVVGQTAAFVGFVAAFWHIDKIAGMCAIVAAIIGMAVHSAGYAKFYKADKDWWVDQVDQSVKTHSSSHHSSKSPKDS